MASFSDRRWFTWHNFCKNRDRYELSQQFSLWNESTGFQRFTGLLIIVKTSLYKGFKDLIFHNENCWSYPALQML